jgi:hypothetical protein
MSAISFLPSLKPTKTNSSINLSNLPPPVLKAIKSFSTRKISNCFQIRKTLPSTNPAPLPKSPPVAASMMTNPSNLTVIV